MSADLNIITMNCKADDKIATDIGLDVDNALDVDRRWNGRIEFCDCEECNGPMMGHRAEKCRMLGGGYNEDEAKRFET